jgi:voltage-gated potassium channel Kch
VIRLARELNPEIRVVARASYLRELPLLRKAGADAVFAGEGEVALTMTEHLLRQLGASGEQIDRERDRIRSELFGAPLTVELLLPAPSPAAKPADQPPQAVAIDAPADSAAAQSTDGTS